MKHHLSFLAGALASALIACGGSTADTTDGGGGGGNDGSMPPNDATVSDTGTTTDGTVPPTDTGLPPTDGGGMGMIRCGMTATCNAATQVCCITGMGTAIMESCVSIGACMGISVPCTGPSNCPTGDVCCGTFVMGGDAGGGIQVSCTATCTGRELCETNADCPMGEQCRRGPGGFRECRQGFDGGPPFDAGPPPDAGLGDTGTGG